MKVVPSALGAGVALVVFCLTSPAFSADDGAMMIASALKTKYEEAVTSKDAAKIAELFSQDAVFQNSAGVFRGRTAIQHYREGASKQGSRRKISRLQELRKSVM